MRGLGEGVVTNESAQDYVDPESPVFGDIPPPMAYPAKEFTVKALSEKPLTFSKADLTSALETFVDPYSTHRLMAQHLHVEKLYQDHLRRVLAEQWPGESFSVPEVMEPAVIEMVAPGVVVSPEECHVFAQNFMSAVNYYG